ASNTNPSLSIDRIVFRRHNGWPMCSGRRAERSEARAHGQHHRLVGPHVLVMLPTLSRQGALIPCAFSWCGSNLQLPLQFIHELEDSALMNLWIFELEKF